MAQRLTACRSIQLSLLIFLTASNALGHEPRAQPREALAQSLARRDTALAEPQRADVLAEVALRAQEMNVRAPIGTLTDLLWERREHAEGGARGGRVWGGGAGVGGAPGGGEDRRAPPQRLYTHPVPRPDGPALLVRGGGRGHLRPQPRGSQR